MPTTLVLPSLPVALTSFIGREAVAAAIAVRLRQPETRLLTLTGFGGVGKTRLAIKVAADVRSDFPDGVGFIPLAAVREPNLVLTSVAQHLGLKEGDRRSLLHRLQAHLAGRHCLLVLDNFEQVADAAPALTDLLAACPDLTLLVTSRTLLRVSGEQTFPVPPLTLPAPGEEAEVIDAEAVHLFLDRATAVRPDVVLTEATAPAIAALCARLDGLPLAIELAAARTNLLSPPELLARLDQRLPLLTGGPRDQPVRLQTMRAAIAWSYDLLTTEEQVLFRCLAVFVDTFALDAVVAVCGLDKALVVERLAVLVDQSLVQATAGAGGEPRYAMLESIREFGLEQMAPTGEDKATSRRHAEHFLNLVGSINPELYDSEQVTRIHQLDADRPNILAALTWFLEQGDAESAQRLAASPWQYWEMRGYLTEGREWLERALALPGNVNAAVRAHAGWRLGYFCYDLGDFDNASTHLAESLALYETIGHRWGTATALTALGLLVGDQGDLPRAQAHHEQALALRRELGDKTGTAISLGNLGNVAHARGDFALARASHEESLALRREIGRPRGIAYQSLNLARLAFSELHLGEAKELIEHALAVFDELGDQIGMSFAIHVLGNISAESHDLKSAFDAYSQAMVLHRKLNLQRGLIVCIEDVARVLSTMEAAVSGRLLAAADRLRESTGVTRPPEAEPAWRRALDATRAALGASRFAEVWQAGQTLTLTAAAREVEAALGTLAPSLPSFSVDDVGATIGLDGVDAGLTQREVEVLRLIARGLSNQEIAGELFISPATAKRHVTNILAKLNLPSRGAVISHSNRLGLTVPDSHRS